MEQFCNVFTFWGLFNVLVNYIRTDQKVYDELHHTVRKNYIVKSLVTNFIKFYIQICFANKMKLLIIHANQRKGIKIWIKQQYIENL